MSNSNEKESLATAWGSLLFGLAAAGLTATLLADAATWWQFATTAIAGVLSTTLIAVGIRAFLLHQRRRRAALDAIEAELLGRR